jgi:Ca-activated chloride channel homolog
MKGNPTMTSNSNNGNTASLDQPSITARWERGVVPTNGSEVALLVRVTAPLVQESGRRAPVDAAFVLDRSGSMNGGKLELAKTGVDLATAHLRDDDRAALVVYDDEVATLQPLACATPRLKASLRLALHGVDPGGSTFLSGGWMAGCKELAEAPVMASADGRETRVRRVILLTDGLANVGIADPAELAKHAGELRRRGIATTTVGVGQDFDEGLLGAMAEAGGGHFEYAADPAALRDFFARELRQMTSVATTGFVVTVALPDGVQAELLSVFPVEARDGELSVAIGDLHAGDAIDLLFVVTAGAGAVGETLPVGVTAAWTDVAADRRREADASPEPLRRVAPAEAEGAAADAEVAEQAALQRAAAERRAGLELDRRGDHAGSRARMAVAFRLLEAAPTTARVRAQAAETYALSAMPDDVAYDSHTRKAAQFREHRRRRGDSGSD